MRRRIEGTQSKCRLARELCRAVATLMADQQAR
jgi:hypothetical protein